MPDLNSKMQHEKAILTGQLHSHSLKGVLSTTKRTEQHSLPHCMGDQAEGRVPRSFDKSAPEITHGGTTTVIACTNINPRILNEVLTY